MIKPEGIADIEVNGKCMPVAISNRAEISVLPAMLFLPKIIVAIIYMTA